MRQFGFNEHYTSVSRGVLDGRDLGYFIGVVLLFLSGTFIVLSRRHLHATARTKTAYFVGALLVILISQSVRFRIDLTEEGRYSLSEGTESLLDQVEEPMLIKVYLEGHNSLRVFERLKLETQFMLEEWSARNGNVFFEFINPNEAEKQAEFKNQLATKGINAVQLQVKTKDGESVPVVFPAAVRDEL